MSQRVNHLKNTESQYGWASISLHWISALTIIGMYPLGWYIDTLTYYDPAYRTVPDIHRSIGIILAMVIVGRLAWRWISPPPKSLPQPAALKAISHLVHLGLLALTVAVLISGYMISTADGRAISVFGWFSVGAIDFGIDQQEDIAGAIHWYGATTLVCLAGLHAAAAIKHHLIDKDATFKRMLGIKQ